MTEGYYVQPESLIDRRDLSNWFTMKVGFSVGYRRERNIQRAHAIRTLIRQLPQSKEWTDDQVQCAVERVSFIDNAVVLLRRHVRLLNGGSLRDRQLAVRARNAQRRTC